MTGHIVHHKAVLVKSRTHYVLPDGRRYLVKSGESSAEYRVYPARYSPTGFSCSCLWGTQGGWTYLDESGCSHVQAVVAFENPGRTLSSWPTLTDARRQHRPVTDIGNGVVLTSRKAPAKKSLAQLREILHGGIENEI